MEVDERCSRTGLIGGAVRARLDTEGSALVQFQRPEGRVQMVAGKVADRTGAKLPPGAPADRSVVGMIRAGRHGLQPALPIKACGHTRRFFRSVGEASPAASTRVGPSMHVVDVTDRTVPDPFAGKADVLTGVSEVAELCSDPGLAGGFGDDAGLVDGAAEGLFTVEVFALGHDSEGDHGMRMVRRGEKNCVDVFLLEHLIVVAVSWAALAVVLPDQLERRSQAGGAAIVEHGIIADLVDVAEGDDVYVRLVEELLHVDNALAACADDGYVDLFAGCGVAVTAEYMARYDGEGRGRGGSAQEIPPSNSLLYFNGIGSSIFHILSPLRVHLHFSGS